MQRIAPGAAASTRADVVFADLRTALAPGYQLIRPIGAGGMGSVYLARDPQLKRLVAVKLLASHLLDDPQARARFAREAQAVATIAHPNVVAMYGVGSLLNDVPYFVMQYVHGRSMAEWLRTDGPLPVDLARRILGEVASGLAAAHRRGVIHRDIKPANILFDEETDRVLVSDFGVAAMVAGDDTDTPITQTGDPVGTPAYMSPEQLLATDVDEKTDIYNLGLLGYDLLTARGPYDISSPREILAAHLRDTPTSLRGRRDDVPDDLDALLQSCLAKRPADRPPASEVANRLTKATGELLEWPPPGLESLQGALSFPLRRLRAGMWTLVAAIVAAMVLDVGKYSAGASYVLLLFGPAVVGTVLSLIAVERLIAIRRMGRRASNREYSFATILEVLADTRRNGGAVIAGTDVFAGLDPSVRNRMRVNRVVALALLTLSAVAPLVSLPLALPGPDGGNEVMFLVAVFLPALILTALAERVRRAETSLSRVARPAEHEAARADDDIAPLVKPWYESFDRTRKGQPFGSGWRFGEVLYRTLGVLIVAALSWTAILAVFVVIATASSILFAGRAFAPNSGGRYRDAMSAAPLRAPIDSRVSAQGAGQILYDVASPAAAAPDDGNLRRPHARSYEWTPPPGRVMTAAAADWDRGQPILGALSGLAPNERALLAAWAANPAIDDLRIAGHAAVADLQGAMVVHPLPAGTTPWKLPKILPGRLVGAVNGLEARAALAIAAGRPDSAELMLREAIGVGLLMSNSRDAGISHAGTNVVRAARDGLRELYKRRNPAAAEQLLLASVDAVATLAGDAAGGTGTNVDLAAARRVFTNANLAPSARWDYLQALVGTRCSDLHALAFGSRGWDDIVAEARASLARFDSERSEFDLIVRSPVPSMLGAGWSVLRWPAWIFDRASGGRRFESCGL